LAEELATGQKYQGTLGGTTILGPDLNREEKGKERTPLRGRGGRGADHRFNKGQEEKEPGSGSKGQGLRKDVSTGVGQGQTLHEIGSE